MAQTNDTDDIEISGIDARELSAIALREKVKALLNAILSDERDIERPF